MGWIDDGVRSDAIPEAFRSISEDKSPSQRTRHRAWKHVKHLKPDGT
jgi:hypothetical protein